MKSTSLILLLVFGTFALPAEDQQRFREIEDRVRESLKAENKAQFFEMFYSPTGEAREEEMREEIADMFAIHFRSGYGKIIAVPLRGDNYRRETMGWLASDGLRRAPGPPFAYLYIYPADKNDPDYMGLSMRLARIDGEIRIVFPELQKDVPDALSGKLSLWTRADGTEFWAQFQRVAGDKVQFRTEEFNPMEVDLEELSPKDKKRIEKLAKDPGSLQ